MSAALAGGLLPCLELLLRRAGRECECMDARLAGKLLLGGGTQPGAGLVWLVAYGEARQVGSFIATLGKMVVAVGGDAEMGGDGEEDEEERERGQHDGWCTDSEPDDEEGAEGAGGGGVAPHLRPWWYRLKRFSIVVLRTACGLLALLPDCLREVGAEGLAVGCSSDGGACGGDGGSNSGGASGSNGGSSGGGHGAGRRGGVDSAAGPDALAPSPVAAAAATAGAPYPQLRLVASYTLCELFPSLVLTITGSLETLTTADLEERSSRSDGRLQFVRRALLCVLRAALVILAQYGRASAGGTGTSAAEAAAWKGLLLPPGGGNEGVLGLLGAALDALPRLALRDGLCAVLLLERVYGAMLSAFPDVTASAMAGREVVYLGTSRLAPPGPPGKGTWQAHALQVFAVAAKNAFDLQATRAARRLAQELFAVPYGLLGPGYCRRDWRVVYCGDGVEGGGVVELPGPQAAREWALPEQRCSAPMCINLSGDSEVGLLQQELKSCGRCRAAWYCSRDCQAAHWTEGHKKTCGRQGGTRAEKAGGSSAGASQQQAAAVAAARRLCQAARAGDEAGVREALGAAVEGGATLLTAYDEVRGCCAEALRALAVACAGLRWRDGVIMTLLHSFREYNFFELRGARALSHYVCRGLCAFVLGWSHHPFHNPSYKILHKAFNPLLRPSGT